MRFGLEGKNVPGQLRAKIAEYVEGYELYDDVLQAGRNPKRMPSWDSPNMDRNGSLSPET